MQEVVYYIAGAIFGIALTLIAGYIREIRLNKLAKESLFKTDAWCMENCKAFEKCHANHKDPDDAARELVNEYCTVCPIPIACCAIEREKKGAETR